MRHIDLFTGIGGFTLAAQTVWGDDYEPIVFVEQDEFCQKVLRKHWPSVPIHDDVRRYYDYPTVELVTGGDPCPIRSKARSIWKTKTPDLSGYFLAVVGRSRPRWVVRENVPASDDKDFVTALDLLGYRTIIISTNSAKITAQNRERDFIVGCPPEAYSVFIQEIPIAENDKRYAETKYNKTPAYPVLTTHACRWDTRDGYIWDGVGISVANSKERQKFTGLPLGWLDGLSKTQVAKLTGNAIVPQCVQPIMESIKRIESGFK